MPSSHHRLMWIHPFLDGNGRIARLALDAAFASMRMSGYGLLDIDPLPKHSEKLFVHLLLSGECKRGVIPKVIDMKERTASRLISELLKRDFIESDSKAGAIRLKIGASMASFLFPMLVPERE